MSEDSDYSNGLLDGVRVTCDLIRAGATVDEIAHALPGSGPVELDAYHQYLRELRLCMGIDSPAFGGGDDQS